MATANDLPEIVEVDWDTAHVESTGGHVMIWYCRVETTGGIRWVGYSYEEDGGHFLEALDNGDMSYDCDEEDYFYYDEDDLPEIFHELRKRAQEMYEWF